MIFAVAFAIILYDSEAGDFSESGNTSGLASLRAMAGDVAELRSTVPPGMVGVSWGFRGGVGFGARQGPPSFWVPEVGEKEP